MTTYNGQPARQRGVEMEMCGVVVEMTGGGVDGEMHRCHACMQQGNGDLCL